jgi:predicted nucleic acid-binding protein
VPEIIVVDTDILIDAGRNITDAVTCLEQVEAHAVLAISAMSEMELIVGLRNKAESRALDNFLSRFQIIPLDEQISSIAIDLLRRYNLSHGLLIPDALIAATAISKKLSFVTKNVRDYRFIPGLDLLPYPQPFKI